MQVLKILKLTNFSPSSIENDSCQLMSRKKRRGVIEKKRRDRINSSLTELKRLVPSAFEKQGSAKLEKAEILQLTVDHLKTLHSKGKKFVETIKCEIFKKWIHHLHFRPDSTYLTLESHSAYPHHIIMHEKKTPKTKKKDIKYLKSHLGGFFLHRM